jgi:hypothetical protein
MVVLCLSDQQRAGPIPGLSCHEGDARRSVVTVQPLAQARWGGVPIL